MSCGCEQSLLAQVGTAHVRFLMLSCCLSKQWLSAVLQEGSSATTYATHDTNNHTTTYSVSIVRLADPQHAQLALINVTDSNQDVQTVCSSSSSGGVEPPPTAAPVSGPLSPDGDFANGGSPLPAQIPGCDPDVPLAINVSSETKWVSLQPGLLYPEVDGIRVEVKGQVLSQGGDVGADQIADTSGHSNSTR